jgi:predicted porin
MNRGVMKAASQGAIAALASLLLSTGSAQSADLGGNCCADLEERVAELEATSVRKGNRRVSLTLSGQVNRSLMYWNDGFTDDVYSVDNAISNSRFRLTGSGKISADLTAGFYMEFSMALGARSHQVSQIDDDGFTGSGGILGSAILGDGIGGAGDSVLDFNQSYWYVDSKHWGRLSVGRLVSATGGVSIIDLSNTGVVANSQPFLWGGGMLLRSGAGSLAALTWGQMCGGPGSSATAAFVGNAGPYSTDCGIHALDRRDAVLYQTPTWHGFTFSGSFGEDDFWDVAGRYAGEWYGFRVAAGLGYRWYDDREPDVLIIGPPGRRLNDTHRRHWLSSASLMHIATGLFVSGAWTQYQYEGFNPHEIFDLNPNRNRPDTDLWWVDAGIEKNWTGIGLTTFYAEYGHVGDGITGLVAAAPTTTGGFILSGLGPLGARGVVTDSDMDWWGVGAVQKIDAAAMDLYLAYRQYSADVRLGTSANVPGSPVQIPGGLEDIWYIQGGARIQF